MPRSRTSHTSGQAPAESPQDDALGIVARWQADTENAPAGTDSRDAAADLAFRLEGAGHTLPEVTP